MSAYEDFLIQGILAGHRKEVSRQTRPRESRRVRRFVGGYGALHLAFVIPKLFSAASAHSAALSDKLPSFLGGGVARISPRARVFGGNFRQSTQRRVLGSHSPIALRAPVRSRA